MKAIILERRGEYAAALREDGIVLKIRQAGEVGEEIELEAEILRLPVQRKRWMRTAAAVVAAVMVLGGSSTYVFAMPAAYVSLDAGETSVEMSVNRVGRVISVKPTSEDDTALARTLNSEVRGKRVEDALAQTMTLFRQEGYLDGQDGAIIAGVTSASETRGAALADALETAAAQSGSVPIYTLDVAPEERETAKENNVSGGRYVYEHDDGFPARGTAPTETEPPRESRTPEETVAPDNRVPPAPTPAAQTPRQEDSVPGTDAPDQGPDAHAATGVPDQTGGPEANRQPAQGETPVAAVPTAQPQNGRPAVTPPAQSAAPAPGDPSGNTEPQASSAPAPSTQPRQPENEAGASPAPAQTEAPEIPAPTAKPETEQQPDGAFPTQGSSQDNGGATGEPSEGQEGGAQPSNPPQGRENTDGNSEPGRFAEQAPNGGLDNSGSGEPAGNPGARQSAPDGDGAPGGMNSGPGR